MCIPSKTPMDNPLIAKVNNMNRRFVEAIFTGCLRLVTITTP